MYSSSHFSPRKLLTKGEKIGIGEQRNRLSNHLRNLLTFETLPDEIVVKIIKMTVSHGCDRDKVLEISKLSSRFNRIARDKSLWRGAVGLSLNLNRYNPDLFGKALRNGVEISKHFLGEGVTSLTLWNSGVHASYFAYLYGEDIATIAGNCPNMASLTLLGIVVPENSWAAQAISWGLKHLKMNTDSQWTNDMFEDVKLDLIFPKLESFIFSAAKYHLAKPLKKHTILLPDLTACKNLQEVHIAMIVNGPGYKFRIPSELEGTGPFPRCLKMLRLHGSICNYPEETILINRGPDCKVILQDPLDCWAGWASKWFSTSH